MSITKFFAIISKTPQMVLKRFYGRTNISLMFLSPWLDCGIDILDFEKIDFLGSLAILAFQPLKTRFFAVGPF